jgi:Ca-activated chloride channel family protein
MIVAEAANGIARIRLEQTFANPYREALQVRYQVPLPHDGAVSGFAFQLGDERITGRVDRKADARADFERAVLQGKTAALLEQERGSLFTQQVGNIPPGTSVVCEITIDQKLVWLDEGDCRGGWEWRFPTVVAPRYLGSDDEGGVRTADAARIEVDASAQPMRPRAQLSLRLRDSLTNEQRPESPSHELSLAREPGGYSVTLASESGARLDRDVVVRWQVAGDAVATRLAHARPDAAHARATDAFGLITLLPPKRETRGAYRRNARDGAVPRDLILLIDASGSMHGEPLDQARRVSLALIDSLGEADSFELIAFANSPVRCARGRLSATEPNKIVARKWLASLQASGGTEMQRGIIEALRPVRREGQRQVVLITDGLIGFETVVLREIVERLPKGSRVHTVGVGCGVNRSLTTPAARAGRGVEVIIGIGEDPERAAARILARTCAPLVVDLSVSGSAVRSVHPERLPDLFAGCPVLLPVQLDASGGEVVVTGTTANGEWRERITVPASKHGEGSLAVATLFAREAVEDLETRHAVGESADEAIEKLGLDFQIATRTTSWVAISDKATVDPRDASRSETMPHEIAYGMSVESLGLRPAMPCAAPAYAMSQSLTLAGGYMPPRPMDAPPPAPAAFPLGGPARYRGKAEEQEYDELLADIPDGAAPAPLEEKLAPPKKKAAPGLLGRVRSLFARKPRELVVEGRVTASGNILVVSFQLPEALSWRPTDATCALQDGSRCQAAVIVAHTTRDGDLEAGLLVRIGVEPAIAVEGDTLGELIVGLADLTLKIRIVND